MIVQGLPLSPRALALGLGLGAHPSCATAWARRIGQIAAGCAS